MQLHRLSHLVFPQPSATPASEKGIGSGLGKGQAESDAAAAQPSPGVLYTGTVAGAHATGAQEEADIASLSLEELITLGKSKGVFNHITYTRNGTFGQTSARLQDAPPVDFVASAVNIMRDFQEGMATLKTDDIAAPAAKSQLWENGLKSIRQAVGRLNATA